MNPIISFNSKQHSGKDLVSIKPGVTLRVYQKINDSGKKTRTQIFEGLVIARKHGMGPNSTITVRKITGGIGVERIFPLHSPNIEKFEVVKVSKVRRSKLYYLRDKTAKETRKKTKILEEATKKAQESVIEAQTMEKEEEKKKAEENKEEKTPESTENK